MARPAGLKRERERRKHAKAERKAADRAERRAAKRSERVEPRPAPAPPAEEIHAQAEPNVESSTIPPIPACALCGFEASAGTWLADPRAWPDGPRWVHRLCVVRRHEAQP